MGDWKDFPLPDGSYSDDTRPYSHQDVVNYLPTFAEQTGTRSRMMHKQAPGLLPFAVIGDGPHRGGRDVEGKAFVVSGNALYRVTPVGVAIPCGTIPGTGLVSMTHNQIAGGNELVIGTRDNSYVYNTVTDTLTATGVALSSVDFLGQMILGVSSQRRFWRHSALADALTYSDLDVYSAEASPDRIVGGIVSQSEWLAFGERTTEVFTNSPTENAAFQRIPGTTIERGCINANTLARLDNSVFFVDNNFIPCRLNGYTPVPIAPKAIVQSLSSCDPAKIFSLTWEDKGYVTYYVSCQDGNTWGYDVTSQRWHRRESFGLDRWRLNTLFKWNGEWYGGDYASGNLYKLTWGYSFEGVDTVIPRRLRSGVLHNNGNRVSIHGLKVDMASGSSPSVATDFPAQPDGPTISGAAPDGSTLHAYAGYTYTATGGTPPYVFSSRTGTTLSDTGLSMNASGVIGTPTPTAEGTFTNVPRVTDANGLHDELTDSIDITEFAIDTNWYAVTPSLSAGRYGMSADGLDWSGAQIESAPDTSQSYYNVISGGERIVLSSTTYGRTSDDKGETWTAHTDLPEGSAYDGCFALGAYHISSQGSVIKRSVDGVAFESIDAGGTDDLYGIAGHETLIMAAGYWGHVSSDGLAYAETGLVFDTPTYRALAVDTDGAIFVAGGENNLFAKYEAGAWTQLTSPFAGTASITAVACLTGLWVIGNGDGAIAYGTNLSDMTVSAFDFGAAVYAIAAGGGLVVAVGDDGKIASSTDGNEWTDRTNTFNGLGITSVARDKP